jgi:hypothetical protein
MQIVLQKRGTFCRQYLPSFCQHLAVLPDELPVALLLEILKSVSEVTELYACRHL